MEQGEAKARPHPHGRIFLQKAGDRWHGGREKGNSGAVPLAHGRPAGGSGSEKGLSRGPSNDPMAPLPEWLPSVAHPDAALSYLFHYLFLLPTVRLRAVS